jgi:PPK2 family polyphosphate:nucleotide phosphotransferase
VKLDPSVISELSVASGEPANLAGRNTASLSTDWLGAGRKQTTKKAAEEYLRSSTEELKASQELLWASGSHALLVVLQAMDAAGKDGTIKHVMSGINPQGCEVVAFEEPSTQEQAHNFLWRYSKALPERGRIGIFNRSYYEEVLVVRVHPELLRGQREISGDGPTNRLWSHRFEDINAFERHLDRDGTRIVKIFLHISKDEQKKRILRRLDNPGKYWKFSMSDLAERTYWAQYQEAYEEALTATSTAWAPWYVVPADHKHMLRALVGGILVDAIEQMDLRLPTVAPDQLELISQAKVELQAE